MTWRDLKVSAFIAYRYFFSKKSTHAVNIIATIAVVGIALVAAAMVCVLSVFNGFESFTSSQLSSLSPDYRIVRVDGKPYDEDHIRSLIISELGDSVHVTPVLEAQGLAVSGDNHAIARLYGIDSTYTTVVGLSKHLIDGHFSMGNRLSPTCVIGIGLGAQLSIGVDDLIPITVTLPRRVGRISLSMPQRNFESSPVYVAGVFRVDQPEDADVLYLPINLLRQLLLYHTHEVTSLDLRSGLSIDGTALRRLAKKIGSDYRIEDRYMQHPDIFRVVKVEKWVSFALLLFVLILSLFSVISTLGMLIIEKKADSRTLSVIGARPVLLDLIVLFEGWILSLTGLVIGVVIGTALTLIQQHFGIIKLQSSAQNVFLLDAYPVRMIWSDLILVVIVILAIGWVSSHLAYYIFRSKH